MPSRRRLSYKKKSVHRRSRSRSRRRRPTQNSNRRRRVPTPPPVVPTATAAPSAMNALVPYAPIRTYKGKNVCDYSESELRKEMFQTHPDKCKTSECAIGFGAVRDSLEHRRQFCNK